MNYPIRQDYVPTLYVGREEELQKANEWWWEASKNPKRLLSVTASPATGKTWFLKRIQEDFAQQDVLALWIDVRDLLLPKVQSLTRTRRLNPGLVNQWLKGFIENINQECSGQLEECTIETIEQLANTIDQLAGEISNLCQSNHGICILIDDGDRFDDGGWREFERYFLEPFAKHESLRFVIAVREKRAVTFALKKSEKRINLDPLVPLLGAAQIDLLREQKPVTSSQIIEKFLEILQERNYNLSHPGLNNFICLFAADNPQVISNFNVADIFSSVLEAVYPESKDDIDSLIALLYRLSTLPDEWDVEDITEQFQVSRPIAWDYIQILKDYSLIKQNLNRYEIVIGVREFVRAILQGESFHVVMPGIAVDLPGDFHYKMDKWFNMVELNELCFNMNIDAENALLGESRLSQVIALIKYCERYNRVSDLLSQCQRLRPQVDWLH